MGQCHVDPQWRPQSKKEGGGGGIALMGNPNSGKTTLFNVLTGLRSQTANFSGTTVEVKRGKVELRGKSVELIDLPGTYSINAVTPDEQVTCDLLLGCIEGQHPPDLVMVVVDSTNLERNLFLASQILEMKIPVLIVLTMTDIAHRHGMDVDSARLAEELGCPVVSVHAAKQTGLDGLKEAASELLFGEVVERKLVELPMAPPVCGSCSACPYHERFTFTEDVTAKVVKSKTLTDGEHTDRIDRWLTQPVIGLSVFALVMLGIFYLIFSAASIPMGLIDGLFAQVGGFVESRLAEGDLRSFIVEGVIGGVGGILVFLPQIAILFFFLSLLEDTGYLSRAAFTLDRLLRRIGLPGSAFVPMVSAHACAIPAIMATRTIADKKDRFLTILVLPLLTCSARIPVYAMIVALIFPHDPMKASLLFAGAYGLGVVAALGMAFLFRRTLFAGKSQPLILELPGYKVPSLRNALLCTWDRSMIFVKQAGTVILFISIGLWILATYPKSAAPETALQQIEAGEHLIATGEVDAGEALVSLAEKEINRSALEHSMAGTLGKWIEPVVRPLGFDWQIGVGIISSFAAREVVVSTLSIVYGMGAGDDENATESLYTALRQARRADGNLTFSVATCASLLVFYVLAMQCLPTQAVTKRETGSWSWAIFQLVYMTVLAYACSFVVYQGLRALGYA